MVLLYHFWQYRAYFSVRYCPKKYEKKLVSAIDRYELLRLFSVSGNKVVAILSAIRQRLFSVQHAVLKRDHHFIKFAEQRHEFGNTEFLRVNANRAAGNAVVTGTLIRLPDKIHLEGGRVSPLLSLQMSNVPPGFSTR